MSTSRTTTATADAPVWVQAIGGYELALDMANGTLVCRTSKGRPLKRVPKAARASAAAERLLALGNWLARHHPPRIDRAKQPGPLAADRRCPLQPLPPWRARRGGGEP
jgi:hypothetical protein